MELLNMFSMMVVARVSPRVRERDVREMMVAMRVGL